MGKKYSFDIMSREDAARLDAYIEETNPNNRSEVLRDIVIEKLNNLPKHIVKAPLLEQARKTHPFLEEPFKCRITQDRVQVKDLPCVTDSEFQCRDTQCQAYIRNRLGLS